MKIERIVEIAEQSGFERTWRCCLGVPNKFCSGDSWRGNLSILATAIEREVLAAHPGQPEPLDMLLFCPKCGVQHVDHAEPAVEHEHGAVEFEAWDNPPHRSHLCHACGCIWRPADVPTNGVATIQTRGKADTWDGKPEPRAEVTSEQFGDQALAILEELVRMRYEKCRIVCQDNVSAVTFEAARELLAARTGASS